MGEIERESGDGNWLTTYSDLVTLLLVFFVLLYVMTPGIDESTFNDIIAHFQNSNSVVLEQESGNENQKNDELRDEWKQVKNFLEKRDLSSEVMIQKTDEGVKVTLSDSLTFNSGSARLLAQSKVVLERIAQVIGEDVREVKARGHTDNIPISESSIYRSNWHLGAARSVSVVLFLSDASILQARKFEASSYGKYRPVATNKTPEGRRKNRRVEIYINYEQSNKQVRIDMTNMDRDSLKSLLTESKNMR
jgi:chemotaxis protein MotB